MVLLSVPSAPQFIPPPLLPQATPLAWQTVETHDPPPGGSRVGTPAYDPAAAARKNAARAAAREGRRPPRASWVLSRVLEAGDRGCTLPELWALHETHAPGAFRSRSQLRAMVALLRGAGKVRSPAGRVVCAAVHETERNARRERRAREAEEAQAALSEARRRRFRSTDADVAPAVGVGG